MKGIREKKIGKGEFIKMIFHVIQKINYDDVTLADLSNVIKSVAENKINLIEKK
jgi:hypothetical protein